MKKPYLLAALSVMAVLAAGAPAGAAPAEATGGLQVTIHTHSSGTLLFPVDRLAYDVAEGDDFSYSSRPCGGPAPFNDLGLDFSPDYPGVDDDADGTAPVRHHVEGTITSVSGDRGTLEGTITTVLCEQENGAQVESDSSIVMTFEAQYRRVSENELMITGTFDISPTESTGTFEGLEGQGSIQGVFTCLAHQRDPSQPTCEDLGEFTDFVGMRGDPTRGPGDIGPGLRGTFRDPSVETAA